MGHMKSGWFLDNQKQIQTKKKLKFLKCNFANTGCSVKQKTPKKHAVN